MNMMKKWKLYGKAWLVHHYHKIIMLVDHPDTYLQYDGDGLQKNFANPTLQTAWCLISLPPRYLAANKRGPVLLNIKSWSPVKTGTTTRMKLLQKHRFERAKTEYGEPTSIENKRITVNALYSYFQPVALT